MKNDNDKKDLNGEGDETPINEKDLIMNDEEFRELMMEIISYKTSWIIFFFTYLINC